MKRKLFFIITILSCLIMFVAFNLTVSATTGDELPIDIEEPQPSELAKWLEENIIPIVVSTASGISLQGVGLYLLVAFIKKKNKKSEDERSNTNVALNKSSLILEESRALLTELTTVMAKLITENNDMKKVINDLIDNLKNEKEQNKANIDTIMSKVMSYVKEV